MAHFKTLSRRLIWRVSTTKNISELIVSWPKFEMGATQIEMYIMTQNRAFHIKMRECIVIDGLLVLVTMKCPPTIKQSHCIRMGKKPNFRGLKQRRNKLKLILNLLTDNIPLKCYKGSCGCVVLQRLRN
jgi:hypothetical protein